MATCFLEPDSRVTPVQVPKKHLTFRDYLPARAERTPPKAQTPREQAVRAGVQLDLKS